MSTAELRLNGTTIISESGGAAQLTSAVSLANVDYTSLADDSISGDKIDGGTISNFSSTGITDNATETIIRTSNDGTYNLVGVNQIPNFSTFSISSHGSIFPSFNIYHGDGSFWRVLGTVMGGGSSSYIHVKTNAVWNDASMTMFRISGFKPYSAYTYSFMGCYLYGNSSYRYTPYGQVNSNLGNNAAAAAMYNSNADPGYFTLVLYQPTSYSGLMIEHIGAGSGYGAAMLNELKIIEYSHSTGTAAIW